MWQLIHGKFSTGNTLEKTIGVIMNSSSASPCIALVEFELSTTGIAVYADGKLLHTFTSGFNSTKQYYVYPCGYYKDSKVEILE
jgi:hypothetical protein